MENNKTNIENTIDRALADRSIASIDSKTVFVVVGAIIFTVLVVWGVSLFNVLDRPSERAQQSEVKVRSPEEDAENRERFKQLLSNFDSNLQPILDAQDLADWRKAEVEEIHQIKESAIANFAKGIYSTAISEIENARQNTESLVNDWKLAYEQQFGKALSAFEHGNLDVAEIELNKALAINSIDPRGHELQQKIINAPLINDLFEQLNVAYTENNLDKTITIYQNILQLAPEREDVKEALNESVYIKQNTEFQSHIQKGLDLINKGDLDKADEQYELAKSIFPNRVELQSLAEKLDSVESDQVLESIYLKIERGTLRDDWQYLAKLTNEAVLIYPSDPLINEYRNVSSQVLALLASGVRIKDQAERMSDLTIQEEIKSYVKEALKVSKYSQSLQQLVVEISQNLRLYSVKHDVELSSDGKTHIIVMGEGVVGKTKSKTIQLPLGTYVFEGSRKGYRSKQISVVVDGQKPVNVTLECDERIR